MLWVIMGCCSIDTPGMLQDALGYCRMPQGCCGNAMDAVGYPGMLQDAPGMLQDRYPRDAEGYSGMTWDAAGCSPPPLNLHSCGNGAGVGASSASPAATSSIPTGSGSLRLG